MKDKNDIKINDIRDQIQEENQRNHFDKRKQNFNFIKLFNSSTLLKYLREQIEQANQGWGILRKDYFELNQKQIDSLIENYLSQNKLLKLEDTQELELFRLGLEIYKALKSDKTKEVYILLNEADTLFQKYPYLNILDMSYNEHHIKPQFPTEILEQKLYLGNLKNAMKEKNLDMLKITHIISINSQGSIKPKFQSSKFVLNLEFFDYEDALIYDKFKIVYVFINDAFQSSSHNKVFVHCEQGRSRSATFVIMYLMKFYNIKYQETLEYVKMQRKIVEPNLGFQTALQKFEQNNQSLEEPIGNQSIQNTNIQRLLIYQ